MSDQLVRDLPAGAGSVGVPQHTRGGSARLASPDSLLDVAYRVVDSPIGALLLAATPNGLVRVGFEIEGHDAVLASLADRVSPRVLLAPRVLDPVARQLDEYFALQRKYFDVTIDLRLAQGFRQVVLTRLREVPYGQTTSYARLAAASGSPAAVRAAGSACAKNPVPLFIPCHRVVKSDGTIGQYGGGVAAKQALLALEVRPRGS